MRTIHYRIDDEWTQIPSKPTHPCSLHYQRAGRDDCRTVAEAKVQRRVGCCRIIGRGGDQVCK